MGNQDLALASVDKVEHQANNIKLKGIPISTSIFNVGLFQSLLCTVFGI